MLGHLSNCPYDSSARNLLFIWCHIEQSGSFDLSCISITGGRHNEIQEPVESKQRGQMSDHRNVAHLSDWELHLPTRFHIPKVLSVPWVGRL